MNEKIELTTTHHFVSQMLNVQKILKVYLCMGICGRVHVHVCVCVKDRAITLAHYLSWSKMGHVFLLGCWADLILKALNRGGTKASEPEGGGEWMSWWDDNAAWHLWNESLVTMVKEPDGTVSQVPQIKPAVSDGWLVFRSCSCSAETFCQLLVHQQLCWCSLMHRHKWDSGSNFT